MNVLFNLIIITILSDNIRRYYVTPVALCEVLRSYGVSYTY